MCRDLLLQRALRYLEVVRWLPWVERLDQLVAVLVKVVEVVEVEEEAEVVQARLNEGEQCLNRASCRRIRQKNLKIIQSGQNVGWQHLKLLDGVHLDLEAPLLAHGLVVGEDGPARAPVKHRHLREHAPEFKPAHDSQEALNGQAILPRRQQLPHGLFLGLATALIRCFLLQMDREACGGRCTFEHVC